jgi:hypothetical protein
MDATKEQIERLLKETSDTIGCLYATILEDISILNACDDSVSSLFKLVRELRRDTSYILVDLHSALHSLLSTEKPIEKRFHLMFISADMLECYKLLYNFGKNRSIRFGLKLAEYWWIVKIPIIMHIANCCLRYMKQYHLCLRLLEMHKKKKVET